MENVKIRIAPLMPPRAGTRAGRRLAEREAVEAVLRALNAWLYGAVTRREGRA
jgi:uncharacterized membrane protein